MKIIKKIKSKDSKTAKYLEMKDDGNIIETGYYSLDEHIICISSQIGCNMGCIFCATTKPFDKTNPNKPFIRNLNSSEIVDQVENILKSIKPAALKSKKILFSFMGMGEPFLNYNNVLKSIKILTKKYPNSRVTISTLGINPALIRKLAHLKINTVLKLHLSLHAASDDLRKKILPKSKKIKPALDALKYFSEVRCVPIKVNYVLIKGINDSEKDALELARLLKPYKFTVKLSNLNDFNDYCGSSRNQFKKFEKILNSKGIETCSFFSTGTDIKAGCGQFRRHHLD